MTAQTIEEIQIEWLSQRLIGNENKYTYHLVYSYDGTPYSVTNLSYFSLEYPHKSGVALAFDAFMKAVNQFLFEDDKLEIVSFNRRAQGIHIQATIPVDLTKGSLTQISLIRGVIPHDNT